MDELLLVPGLEVVEIIFNLDDLYLILINYHNRCLLKHNYNKYLLIIATIISIKKKNKKYLSIYYKIIQNRIKVKTYNERN